MVWHEHMRDSEFARNIPASWPYIWAGYLAGGNEAHAWDGAEWAMADGRKKLPIFVRLNAAQASGIGDGFTVLRQLFTHGVPQGTPVALDLETQQAPAYVKLFGQVLRWAGYRVWVYGSASTVFGNPALDGYWVADYAGHGPFMFDHAHVMATQYASPSTGSGGQWDSSTVRWLTFTEGKWWV